MTYTLESNSQKWHARDLGPIRASPTVDAESFGSKAMFHGNFLQALHRLASDAMETDLLYPFDEMKQTTNLKD